MGHKASLNNARSPEPSRDRIASVESGDGRSARATGCG
ncbi:hypothetical protein AK972_4235 [Pseudomonas yamanorum]|nr:hypothetical protein AK972_4235 [Pseudomonas yamanorum]